MNQLKNSLINCGVAFKAFRSRIDAAKEQLINFLQRQKEKKIIGYGASATSTTLISHFQLNQYIDYLVDDIPAKIGTYSPGYHFPVCSSDELLDDSPDIVIILAWRFKDTIMSIIRDLPCKVVVPLPQFEKIC